MAQDNASCALKIDGIRIGTDVATSTLYVPKTPVTGSVELNVGKQKGETCCLLPYDLGLNPMSS